MSCRGLAVLCCSLLPIHLTAQQPGASPAAEPPSVEWQRSLADALAVQQATGLPLLIAVNTDGEVFCDRFATTTYRDPAFVETTRGYVCVVASPDRHTESDYDASGRRIECPRFPGCTCSEHSQIEPLLYARWFKGQRTAPRHIAVAADGTVLFDRFLDGSMQTAIDAIRKHRGTPPATQPGDSVQDLLQRRDAAARRRLEQRYQAGSARERIELLTAAAASKAEPFDLLRLGLRADDDGVFAAAARTLGSVATANAVIDLEDALARAGDADLRAALLGGLRRVAASGDAAAQRLAAHTTPLPAEQRELLGRLWGGPWQESAGGDRDAIEARLDRHEATLKRAPDDDATRIALAIDQWALARQLIATRDKGVELWLIDAGQSAARVKQQGLQPHAAAVTAVTALLRGDFDAAEAAVDAAIRAGDAGLVPPDAELAQALLEATVQLAARRASLQTSADPTSVLLPQLRRTGEAMLLLSDRGGATETTTLAAATVLELAGLRQEARQSLRLLLDRFPGSPAVHERWRARLMLDLGTASMLREYAAWVATAADRATALWFHGYAALVAGDQDTRDRRAERAADDYQAAIDRFAACVAERADFAESANHFAVLACAGRALLRHQQGAPADAIALFERALALRPASLDETDGLGRKPRAIGDRIARELAERGDADDAERLRRLLR